MPPKKVLVSSAWIGEMNKLKKKVETMDALEQEVAAARAVAEEKDGLHRALTNFQEEYEAMKAANALEVERRVKALKQQDKLKDQLKAAERMANNHKVNAKRLQGLHSKAGKKFNEVKKQADALRGDVVKKEDQIRQQLEHQREMGKLMRRREKELEREREERLKDMHTKVIHARQVKEAEYQRDRLVARMDMQDSIANQHTYESTVLVEALRCSKSVAAVYSADLNDREEELQDVKVRLMRAEQNHKDALEAIEDEQYRRRDLERQHRRLQSYLMATAKSSSEISAIMQPRRSRVMDAAEAQFGGGGMGMGMSGNGASALGQSNLMLGDMLEDDDGRPENNVVRRDVEPPLYQAPTFSHLVRSQENLQLLHRPVGSGSVLQGAGSKLQFSSSRVHAPAPSAEPLGFGAAGSRFVKPRLQDAASVETLRVVQPPPRMTRAGGSLADTTAVGRPLIAPRVTTAGGGAPDTFDVPWFQDVADAQRPPGGGGGGGGLRGARSQPTLMGGTGMSVVSSETLKNNRRKRRVRRRKDGNSVVDSGGSLFVGSGIGLRKSKVERTMKGSAKQILDHIVSRIDFTKIEQVKAREAGAKAGGKRGGKAVRR